MLSAHSHGLTAVNALAGWWPGSTGTCSYCGPDQLINVLALEHGPGRNPRALVRSACRETECTGATLAPTDDPLENMGIEPGDVNGESDLRVRVP